MTAFLTDIGSVLNSAIGWLSQTVTAMFSSSGSLKELVPFIALGIGVGILGLGVKYIRSFVKIG